MVRSVLRRALEALITLTVASVLVWGLQALTPGDPAVRVLNARNIPHPNAAQVAAQREAMGLDDPPLARFGRWLGGVATGDLGTSWRTGRPVGDEFASRLSPTLRLTALALAMALVGALVVGTLAARFAGRWPDALARALSLAGIVLPSFVVALVLLELVVLRSGVFKVVADGSWSAAILPAAVLSLGSLATWSRLLRAGLLDAHAAGHTEVARARGAGWGRLLVVHDLPNASVPFLTAFGVGTAELLAGAPIVETVFTWPGVGRYAVEAIGARDLPVVQAYTLLAVGAYVVTSMLVDVAARIIDPRLAERSPSGRLRCRRPARPVVAAP